MKTAGDLAGSLRELIAEGAIGDSNAGIDGGAGRPRLLAGLEAHIIQERSWREIRLHNVAAVVNTRPPADKVQQVVSVETQAAVRQAAHILAVEIAIDPAHLSAAGLFDKSNGTLRISGGLLADHAKLHG